MVVERVAINSEMPRQGKGKAETEASKARAVEAIAPGAIAKILTFLPQIQAQSCDRATLQALIDTLYQTQFVFRFDWPQWIAEAERYSQNPNLLVQVNLLTLRKLMTMYVSRDHFAPGYLAQKYEAGILLKILQRLTVISTAGCKTVADGEEI